MDKMVDVVAVSLRDRTVLWTVGPRDETNAEAVIGMAIVRQGLDDRFFTTATPGKYAAGDVFSEGGE